MRSGGGKFNTRIWRCLVARLHRRPGGDSWRTDADKRKESVWPRCIARGRARSGEQVQNSNIHHSFNRKPRRLRSAVKLIRKSLKTDVLTIAMLRLADIEKIEKQKAETAVNAGRGKMNFGEALEFFNQRIKDDMGIKDRTRDYYDQRIRNTF